MHTPMTGRNGSQMRLENRRAVLRTITAHGPVSRRDIAGLTRLTSATITNVVAELVQAKLVVELGHLEEDRPKAGRRAVLVDLNPHGPCVIGVQLGLTRVELSLCNLRGTPFGPSHQLPVHADPQQLLTDIAAVIRQVAADPGPGRGPVLGIGVGAAGLVDPVRGVIRGRPGWEEVSIRDLLASQLKLPVVLDNNVAAMSLAEAWFGHGAHVGNFLYLYVGNVVGLGVVIGRQLYRGTTYSAGQLEHLVVDPYGDPCPCGQRGCLHTVATHRSVVQRARVLARPGSPLAQVIAGERSTTAAAVAALRLAAGGDPEARALYERMAKRLGAALRQLHALFDPELVVLAGAYMTAAPERDWLVGLLRELAAVPVPLVASRFDTAPLTGAAVLVLEQLFDPTRFSAGYTAVGD